jgi:MYXO-CTERM domain-containing protein
MGMQILGQAWSEPALIGLAYSYEQVSHRRVPATVADPLLVQTDCLTAVVPEAPSPWTLPPLGLAVAAAIAFRRRRHKLEDLNLGS